ncbi:uncharacterized protein ATC70_013348 [Mucor velutinosus]|uniref:Uncharacterized protein n=1 Tax=Mucor velutinosus TaxID=708070 RepID=A0AAN7HRK5_9FUNG|nr:hypothetical protein ATC70_013348 [Mucor velutinosus]
MKGRQGINGPNANGGNHPTGPTIRPHQMTPQELHEAQSPQDQFSPDMNENTSGDGVWGNRQTFSNNRNNEMDITDETDPLSRSQQLQQRSTQQQPPQPSAWDKIRSENLPNNTWSRIRMEAQKNPESAVDIEKAKAARLNKLRENSDFGNSGEREIPRTREEALERGSTSRRNQWGDPLE